MPDACKGPRHPQSPPTYSSPSFRAPTRPAGRVAPVEPSEARRPGGGALLKIERWNRAGPHRSLCAAGSGGAGGGGAQCAGKRGAAAAGCGSDARARSLIALTRWKARNVSGPFSFSYTLAAPVPEHPLPCSPVIVISPMRLHPFCHLQRPGRPHVLHAVNWLDWADRAKRFETHRVTG